MQSLLELLQKLFNSTLSTDIAQPFAVFLVSGNIDAGSAFNIADINAYCAKYMVCQIRIKTYQLPNFH